MLAVGVIGLFGYAAVSLCRYRCRSAVGRRVRTVSIVLFGWWAWTVGFGLTFPLPVVGADAFLYSAVAAMTVAGIVESETSNASGTV